MAIKELQLPLSDVKIINLPKVGQFYTKAEVDRLIKEAVDEARRIDEESMRCLLYTSPSPRDRG